MAPSAPWRLRPGTCSPRGTAAGICAEGRPPEAGRHGAGPGARLPTGRWPLPRRGAGRARQGADGGAWGAWGRGPCEGKGKTESWKRRRPTHARYPFLHLTPRPRPQRIAPSWKNDGYDRTVPRAHLGTSKAGWCPPFNDMPPPTHLGFPPPPSAEPHWGRWSCVGPAHPPLSPASLRGG